MKTWTYDDITRAMRRQIVTLKNLADEQPTNQPAFHHMATGVWLAWSNLTAGHQRNTDHENLFELAHAWTLPHPTEDGNELNVSGTAPP